MGVDEVGRGCLAGPVYAAVVALDYYAIDDLDEKLRDLIRDSKQLSSKQRAKIVPVIHEVALEYGVGSASTREIEDLGIVPATFLAMTRAYEQLKTPWDLLLIDGNQKHPNLPLEQMTIVGGDALCYAIAAASILAKEARDAVMRAAHEEYPQYGFADHVGYSTKAHLQALRTHGITPLHRRNYAPVRDLLPSTLEMSLDFN
ncbi:MAG: ribonuclease HII [Proteobacteria bacterium]|nr:MAG: ribonuclease HII [Pseudomonadota bacterium]